MPPGDYIISKDRTILPLPRLQKRDQREPRRAIGGLFPQELPEQSRAITARIIKLSPRESSRARHRVTGRTRGWGHEGEGGSAETRDMVGGKVRSRGVLRWRFRHLEGVPECEYVVRASAT